MVLDAAYTRLPGAIGAAKKCFFRLDAVPDNFASAMSANRRKFMNSAFKTIENVAIARRNNLK
jgi:hypothetical protein